ncbi:GNAT family protein [uncultured Clostridium sp.]|uniref:GNAT family N-acetyltransferase n=1 Tax=uncultured Clostridium sp. TaxID=59620 RepID=UPI0028E5293F|nr:GNAT family protein [uncultured Clostridium sp.]
MLKGYNIYLRTLQKRDILILYRLFNDKNVKLYNTIPNDIQSGSKSLRKALSIINEKNVLVGFITYKESNDCKGIYSIGITIGSMYWGKKYGQDSIRTLIQYLFGKLEAIRVELEVVKYNLRAINCYKKCGFVEEGIKKNKVYINGRYVDTIIMGISKKELTDI